MSKKIETYNDLLEEKKRLETLLPVRKQRMVADWDELKLEFVPVQDTFKSLGKFMKRDKSNPLVNMGLNFAGDVILKRVILAKADWVTRFLLPIFLKNYSSHVINGSRPKTVLGKIRELFSKKHTKNNNHIQEAQIADSGTPETVTPVQMQY